VGSATREALAQAVAALAGTDGVTLSTGEQLLAAGRAIEGSLALRAVLADPAVETSRKSELVTGVFGSLDRVALELLRAIVESRWSTQPELLDGIEEVGIRAIAKAADDDARIETELFAFSQVVSSDAELELAIGSKLGDSADRVELVDTLLGPDASPATVAIVRHLVQSPRGRRIGELLSRAADIVADAGGSIVGIVTAASEPTLAQLDRLRTLLAAQYGRTPHLNIIVDPRLVGGLRVQLGDEVIDGSIASRLAELRLRLAG
jgi:F-type H+-transporting ATPase subunit delta